MGKSSFKVAQIIGMNKEQEAGKPTAEVCRKNGGAEEPIRVYVAGLGVFMILALWLFPETGKLPGE